MKIYQIMKLAYQGILRPLVVEKVQSSDAKWDDHILYVLDKIFAGEHP